MVSNFWRNRTVLLTGASGFLGQHVHRLLDSEGATIFAPSHRDYDLTKPEDVQRAFLVLRKPDVVFHLAAVVGGIGANQKYPADFYTANVLMNTYVLEGARRANAGKVVAMGTVCQYPCHTAVPFREVDLSLGYPEETNAAYGIAKRGLLAHCQALRQEYGLKCIYLVPTNLYGPCFSGDTNVLTPSGFKNIKDFKVGDSVYTLNPETHQVENSRVSAVQSRRTKELFLLKNKSVDFNITQEHKIFYRQNGSFQLRPIEDFRNQIGKPFGQITLARHHPYQASTEMFKFSDDFSMESYIDAEHVIKDGKIRDYAHSKSQEFKIVYRTIDIIELLGWFISEGCITQPFSEHRTHGQVRIAQDAYANPEYHQQISELLTRMQIPFGSNSQAFYFTSRLFKNFFEQEVRIGSENKHIPSFVFDAAFPTEWRKLLYETLMKGDGNKNGRRYTTKSRLLKDDMMHLCFLLGFRVQSRHDGKFWRISIQVGKRNPTLKFKNVSTIMEDSDVFCITTDKNHIIYAGRNGKFNWIGQCDNFNPDTSHVIPALLRKFHEAKEANASTVEVWGSGNATRDFLYVEDCAKALLLAAERYDSPDPVNLGTAVETSITSLAEAIKGLTTYEGVIQFNQAKPDGQPRRVLDTSRAKEVFSWWATTPLKEGLHKAYAYYLETVCHKSAS